MNGDVEDLVIAGCQVHLKFCTEPNGQWSVLGTVRCGAGENEDEQSLRTDPCDSREAAEQEALRAVYEILGPNVDRNTSRVRNWS